MLAVGCGVDGVDGAGSAGSADSADSSDSTGNPAEDPSATVTQNSNGGFVCSSFVGVGVNCVGTIGLPIIINITHVRVLNNSQLNVLSGDLNNLSLLDGNILDGNRILNDVELTVLSDFLNKFSINVTKNNINVCGIANLGIQFCK
jgi:hypothetical protein